MPKSSKSNDNFEIHSTLTEMTEIFDPSEYMKKALNDPAGKKLIDDLTNIKNELDKKGLKLEDHLIVGDRTLKEATKNWDEKVTKDNIVQYAALFIGACNHMKVPVTYVCPNNDLTVTERAFNDSTAYGKDGSVPQEEAGPWTKFWDWLCSKFNVETLHVQQEKIKNVHGKVVDEVRTTHMQKTFLEKSKKSYDKTMEVVGEIRNEEKKWEKLFFGEDAPLMLNKGELQKKSPLDICMRIAVSELNFNYGDTPETLSSETKDKLREIGQRYNQYVKEDKYDALKSDMERNARSMDFRGLADVMQNSLEKNHAPNMVNQDYDPLADSAVRQEMIKAAPLLKHMNMLDYGSTQYGVVIAKETLGRLENAAKGYEAIKNQKYDEAVEAGDEICESYKNLKGIKIFLKDKRSAESKLNSDAENKLNDSVRNLYVDGLYRNMSSGVDLQTGPVSVKGGKPNEYSPLAAAMMVTGRTMDGSMSKYDIVTVVNGQKKDNVASIRVSMKKIVAESKAYLKEANQIAAQNDAPQAEQKAPKAIEVPQAEQGIMQL